MKRIILLRFHKDIEIVQNRIDLLKKFNPVIPIHGLFGGQESEFAHFNIKLQGLESLTQLVNQDSESLWKRSDESIREWYVKTGAKIDFEVVYTIEYDLIYLDHIENLVELLPNSIALTGVIKLADIVENWDWLTESPYKEESLEFLDWVKNKFGLEKFRACLGPGAVLTKEFLKKYSEVVVPPISHDELRFPQLAEVFGINVVDTGFYDNWNNVHPETELSFNCNKVEVSMEKLIEEYKGGKRKVFHPIYGVVPLERL